MADMHRELYQDIARGDVVETILLDQDLTLCTLAKT